MRCAEALRDAFRLPSAARAILLASLLSAPLSAGAAPDIRHWQTENGARVFFVEAHELPMVQVRVVFDAGSARDPARRGGVAALTSAMLTQGADGLDADAIAEGFADLGVEFTTDSLRDMAVAELRSLSDPETLGAAVDLANRVIGRPDFPAADLERERARLLTALRQEAQDPGTLVEQAFFEALYGDHPYGHWPHGTPASLKAMDRADLADFHRRYYVAANAVIAIVGDLDKRAAQRLAARLTRDWPRGQAAPPLPPAPAREDAAERRIPFPSSQAHLRVGQAGMRRGDPDYFPLYVGNYVLGGGGLVSRLAEEVREARGLAYSVYSYFLPMRVAGPFMIGLQTRRDQADLALDIARKTLARFAAEGPTGKELEAAKRHLTGGFPLRIDSNRKIAEYLAMIGFYGLPLDYLETFPGRVAAVDLAAVRDAFHRRLHPERMVTVVVGGADR